MARRMLVGHEGSPDNFVSDEIAYAGGAHDDTLINGLPGPGDPSTTVWKGLGSALKENLSSTCDGVYLIAIAVYTTAGDPSPANTVEGVTVPNGDDKDYRRYYMQQYTLRVYGCAGSTVKVRVGCYVPSGYWLVPLDPTFPYQSNEPYPPRASSHSVDYRDLEITLAAMDWTRIASPVIDGSGSYQGITGDTYTHVTSVYAKILNPTPGDYRYENKYFQIPLPDTDGVGNGDEVDWQVPADLAHGENANDIPNSSKSVHAVNNSFDVVGGTRSSQSPQPGVPNQSGQDWPQTWCPSPFFDAWAAPHPPYPVNTWYTPQRKFALNDRIYLGRNGSQFRFEEFGAYQANDELHYLEAAVAVQPPSSCTSDQLITFTLHCLDHRTGLLITDSDFGSRAYSPDADLGFAICSGLYDNTYDNNHCQGFMEVVSETKLSTGVWQYQVRMKSVGVFAIRCAPRLHPFLQTQIGPWVFTDEVTVSHDTPHFIQFVRKDIRDPSKTVAGEQPSFVGDPLVKFAPGGRAAPDFAGVGYKPGEATTVRRDYAYRGHPLQVAILDRWGNLCDDATNTVDVDLSLAGHEFGNFRHLTGTTSVAAVGGIATFDSFQCYGLGKDTQLLASNPNADNFYLLISSSGLVAPFAGVGGDIVGPFALCYRPKFQTLGPFRAGIDFAFTVLVADLYGVDLGADDGDTMTLADGDLSGRFAGGFTGVGSVSVLSGVATFRGNFPAAGKWCLSVSAGAEHYAGRPSATGFIEVGP